MIKAHINAVHYARDSAASESSKRFTQKHYVTCAWKKRLHPSE